MRKDRVLELAGLSYEERIVLIDNRLVDDVLTKYAADNLLWDNVLENPAEAVAMNRTLLEAMNRESRLRGESLRKHTLSRREAKSLYESVTRHPIARMLKHFKSPSTSVSRLANQEPTDPFG